MEAGKLFRAEDWWIGKASMLMGLVYMLSALFGIAIGDFCIWALCSMATISGFAAVGYLLNDYFDQEKDRLAGKKNFLLGKSPAHKVFFFLLAITLMAAPWLVLPHDRLTLGLILSQVAAYLIYSVPPLRLKERGMSGIVVDALYAHGIPAVMATYTYLLISAFPFVDPTLFILLFFWQFVAGVRNVLMHQQNDLESDALSGTATYLAGGRLSAIGMLFISVLELFLLSALLIWFARFDIIYLIPLLAVGASLGTCMQMSRSNGYRIYYPNILYDQWLPYAFILVMGAQDIRFLILIPIHGILFSREIVVELYSRVPWGKLREALRRGIVGASDKIRLMGNWMIYIFFRLGGVDLIKENTDAMGYIRRRRNKAQR